MRKSLDRAGDQVEAEDVQQGNEPPGVVHVKEAELGINLKLRRAYLGDVLRGDLPLWQDRTDDRGQRQGD